MAASAGAAVVGLSRAHECDISASSRAKTAAGGDKGNSGARGAIAASVRVGGGQLPALVASPVVLGGTSNPAFHGPVGNCGSEDDDVDVVVDGGKVVREPRLSLDQLGASSPPNRLSRGSLGRAPVWPDQPASNSCPQARGWSGLVICCATGQS